MQMFSKVIRDCRRAQFKEAQKLDDLTGQQTIKGSLWLLLSNRKTLKESDQTTAQIQKRLRLSKRIEG